MKKYNYIKSLQRLVKIFQEKKCMHYDHDTCDGVIIRSHTIQKKRALKEIEGPKGHVWGFVPNMNLDLSKDALILDKIGINEASTFFGFCKSHDNNLFHIIDDLDFIPTDEQVFMLTYRTIAREVYTKIASNKTSMISKEIIDETNNLFKEIMKGNLNAMNFGTERGLLYSLIEINKMYNSLKRNDFSKICYLVIKTKNFSNVMTSGAITPEYDYDENQINDFTKTFHWISLNIFTDDKNGLIVFSWLKDPKSEQFVNSLIQQNDFMNKIVEIAFRHIENTYFSKEWWDSLKTVIRIRINEMVQDWTHYERKGFGYKYKGIRKNNLHYQDLEIDKIITNSNILQTTINSINL